MLDYGSRLGAFFAKVAGARMASHQILAGAGPYGL